MNYNQIYSQELAVMLSSVPLHKHEDVSNLLSNCAEEEEERLQSIMKTNNIYNNAIIKKLALKKCLPIAIARLVMDIWSHSMQEHVEILLLKMAIDQEMLRDYDLPHVTYLNSTVHPRNEWNDWKIENCNEIVLLLWDVFGIRKHYNQVYSDRKIFMDMYNKLAQIKPKLLESLPGNVADRHDLSLFSLDQAIGYTLFNVHNCPHRLALAAYKLHINNEPHHPEMWSFSHTALEKKKKMELWWKTEARENFYHFDPMQLPDNLTFEYMPFSFLLEYYISVVAETSKKNGIEYENMPLLYFTQVTREDLGKIPDKQKACIIEFIKHLKDRPHYINLGCIQANLDW
uniref:Uncharacterized protein n=1 Tax=Metapenaeus ensis majanivirus TaxID=2984279 RepID=A0A9C7EYN5_9VIRU|nr:MAG: hypothetical protein [Metapenaeus ensis majanivirus]